jgi:hypothetical protein
MSADNTTNNADLSAIKIDPIAWAKRGNKLEYGNVKDLTIDPLLNVRFHGDFEVVKGVKPIDTYDIPSMKLDIVNGPGGGGINTPILVSVREDKRKIVLQGNRRTRAGQELEADPTTPPELLKTLREKTPMILLHGLTPTQEIELVNDQTQKPFLRSEVIRQVFALRKQKWTFMQIAHAMWETLGKFSGNAKKIAEIRGITDAALKKDKIRTWLKGTLDDYLLSACDLGPIVQEYVLLSTMITDNVLPDTAPRPYVNMEKNSQKRVALLSKAKAADGSKWSGVMLIEGSEFKKAIDALHAEDTGTTPQKPKTETQKMMDRKSIEGMKDSFSSRASKAMIERILGGAAPDLDTVDSFAAMMEAKKLVVEQMLPRLKPELAGMLRLVFLNPDPNDFVDALEMNVVEEATTETETETTSVEEMVEDETTKANEEMVAEGSPDTTAGS